MLLVGSGCAGSSAQDESNSPLAPYLPTATPTPGSDQGPATADVPVGSYPTTTAGGYFTIAQERTLAIESDVTVLGYAADPSHFLMLEQVNLSGGIQRWRVLATPSVPGTEVVTWTLLCDILGDNSGRLGFAVDATYYYLPGAIAGDLLHTQYLRRFRRADCSEVSPLDTGIELSSGDYNPFVYSVASNQLFFKVASSGPDEIHSWNLSTGALVGDLLTEKLAGISPAYAYAVFATPQWIWVLTYTAIWKLDLSGNPIAWGSLPSNSPQLSDLSNGAALVALDSNTLVFAVTAGQQVNRYFLDVSHF